MEVNPAHGRSGTNGAGTALNTENGRGNTVSLGQTLTTGTYFLKFDSQINPEGFGSAVSPHKTIWLWDTVNGTFVFSEMHHGSGTIRVSGPQGIPGIPYNSIAGPQGTGSVHVEVAIDLDAKTVNWTWEDNNFPSFNGGSGYTYTGDFAPNELSIWGNGESNVISSGFDNSQQFW